MSSSDTDETPTISFLISNKKKRLLVIDGYIYQQNKSTAKVSYWLCEIKLCNAGVHLNSDDQFRKYTENPHTHMPVPERLEIRKMLTNIKSRVDREAKAIGQIYHEELLKANLFSKLLLSIINSFEIFDFLVFTLTIVQYHSNINKVSILLYICPTSYRGEGLPYIGVKLVKAILVPIAHLCLHVKSLGSLWHHQGSSWSREQLLAAHLEFFNNKFHSTIQSKRTQM
ncbi:unnamed protein product [Rotaria magnacalcarata]